MFYTPYIQREKTHSLSQCDTNKQQHEQPWKLWKLNNHQLQIQMTQKATTVSH